MLRIVAVLILSLQLVGQASASAQNEVIVSTAEQLRSALEKVAQTNIGSTIVLEDGRYMLSGAPLKISTEHVTIRSRSGIREKVIISGQGMDKGVGTLIDVSADYFSLVGVTLQNSMWHLIQVRAEQDVDFFYMENCVLQDSGQQLLKVSGGKTGPYADFGIVKNSLFQYTAGIGPNYYIGGIDAHRSANWLVQNNVFKNIASPAKRVAEHAIHFWSDSSDIRTIGNLIINSDRGIGYGLNDSEKQSRGGIISNNVIIHTATNHPFPDVGIALESSPNTVIRHNTIFLTSSYPNAIEYRFKKTHGVVIEGNVTNKAIKKRNGADATLINNNTAGFSAQVIDNIQHFIK